MDRDLSGTKCGFCLGQHAFDECCTREENRLVRSGKVYDLGVTYYARSYKWPGHSPGTIMTYRSPESERRQGDFKPVVDAKLNPQRIGWHSYALFINDNVATQIDSLGHITAGKDNHWYNGFKDKD